MDSLGTELGGWGEEVGKRSAFHYVSFLVGIILTFYCHYQVEKPPQRLCVQNSNQQTKNYSKPLKGQR